MIKRILKGAAAILLSACMLSGCAFLGDDTDSLLSPPKPSGELYKIQQALEKSVKEKFTLKYPTSGENRSAIIQKDLNGDGAEEAIAFYSTVKDNVVSMHINYISNYGGKWESVGSFKCVAAGIESVEFQDMDNDGVLEILAGWSVYGNVDKMLGVYSVNEGKFAQRINESYTNYLCADFNGNGEKEIFLTYLNSKESTAAAKFLSLEADGQLQLGTVGLDPAVSGYSSPVLSKLPNGNTAVYVDAVKGAGVITEVLEINGKTMKNALLNEENGTVADTFRTTGAAVRDIDDDGVCEIPLVELITQGDAGNDGIYRTDWCVVENGGLTLKLSAIMNYGDGYFIEIPEKWKNKITVTRDIANRIRTFMRIDQETGNSAEVLVRVQTLPVTDNGAANSSSLLNAREIAKTDELRYFVSVGTYKGEESVTLEEFKNYFKLIKN